MQLREKKQNIVIKVQRVNWEKPFKILMLAQSACIFVARLVGYLWISMDIYVSSAMDCLKTPTNHCQNKGPKGSSVMTLSPCVLYASQQDTPTPNWFAQRNSRLKSLAHDYTYTNPSVLEKKQPTKEGK